MLLYIIIIYLKKIDLVYKIIFLQKKKLNIQKHLNNKIEGIS